MYQIMYGIALAVLALLMNATCLCQSMPATAGETLGGKRIVLGDVAPGHSVVLVVASPTMAAWARVHG